MVDDSAQLYTMEGIAAAFIILATAYLVAGTTSVYTPGDSHITDMQLEVLGNDVLAVMDTPIKNGDPSELEKYLSDWNNKDTFRDRFKELLNQKASAGQDNLEFSANVSYCVGDDVKTDFFTKSQEMTGYEQAVRVTRLVTLGSKPQNVPSELNFDNRPQVVMVEVLIWRG